MNRVSINILKNDLSKLLLINGNNRYYSKKFNKQTSIPSIQLIRELRNKTDASIGDCEKALRESENDVEKAHKWLKKHLLVGIEKTFDMVEPRDTKLPK